VPHVDLTKVAEYTAEAAKAGGPDDASLGMLWHKISELPVVTIAKIRGGPAGRAASWRWPVTCGSPRGRTPSWARSRSASARFPGAGGVQHLARLLGRGQAMEAILGASDFDAEMAERYGWINRALPDADPAQARTAALFAQGLQTRGPLELDLGDRIGAL